MEENRPIRNRIQKARVDIMTKLDRRLRARKIEVLTGRNNRPLMETIRNFAGDILGKFIVNIDVNIYNIEIEKLESLLAKGAIVGYAPHSGHTDNIIARLVLRQIEEEFNKSRGGGDKQLKILNRLFFPAKRDPHYPENLLGLSGIMSKLGELLLSATLPIDSDNLYDHRMADTIAIMRILEKSNRIMVIAPEGTRGNEPNFEKLEFKKGIVRFAKKYNKPLLLILIRGAEEIWPKGKAFRLNNPDTGDPWEVKVGLKIIEADKLEGINIKELQHIMGKVYDGL